MGYIGHFAFIRAEKKISCDRNNGRNTPYDPFSSRRTIIWVIWVIITIIGIRKKSNRGRRVAGIANIAHMEHQDKQPSTIIQLSNLGQLWHNFKKSIS